MQRRRSFFTIVHSLGENVTHNVSLYAGDSASNNRFLHSVMTSLSGNGFTVTELNILDSPALLSISLPAHSAGTSLPGISAVRKLDRNVFICLSVLLFAALFWRYTKIYPQRNGYVEL